MTVRDGKKKYNFYSKRQSINEIKKVKKMWLVKSILSQRKDQV